MDPAPAPPGARRGADGEVLSYAPDLTSMTGGRGDYAMQLLLRGGAGARRAGVIAAAQRDREMVKA